MAYPDWVKKHRLPNTEIRCIRGRYYLYNITSHWCPEKKRPKKKTLNQVGVIDEEYGLIPTGMSKKGKKPKNGSKLKDDLPPATDFADHFESLDDPRADRNQLYSLSEILLVTLLAVICGAEGWQDVENFGKAKINYLRQYLDYTNGVPSDDTIRRLFRSINPEGFKEVFRCWVRRMAEGVNAQVIAIDGKSSRRSYDDENDMMHTVSAFATEARVVLGQQRTCDKSNEITAIPKLLELLDVKGHIITIDAMGCQYAIANKIVAKEGDYVLALKGNQGDLSDDVMTYFEDPPKGHNIASGESHDKGHGRVETRTCYVTNDVQWLRDRHPKWSSINSIIKIKATREFKDDTKTTEETRYYVSSLKQPTPETALSAVRQHWAVENSLHWVLDMSFNEDYSRIRKENAPHVMAIIRHIALNLLQSYKPKRQSIKGLIKMCAWDEATLTQVLSQIKQN